MTTVLAVALWLVAALVVAVVLVICIPWCIAFSAIAGPEPEFRAEIRPLGWAVPAVVRLDSSRWQPAPTPSTAETPPETDAEPAPSAHKRRPGRGSRGRARRALGAAPDLLGGVLRRIHIDFLRLSGRIGLWDPADTGCLFGLLFPLSYLPFGSRIAIDLAPAFDTPAFEGEAAAGLRLIPAALLWPVLRFGWSVWVRPSWR